MDSESISEEFFAEYIEYDDLDDDKENQPNNPDGIKKPRVSKQQYSAMDQFHKENSESLVEGALYDILWIDLTSKLNEIGPAVQSFQEWKRKWALRKHYNKQKLKKLSNTAIPLDDEPSPSDESDKPISGHSSGFEKEVLEKLDKILNKLTELIEVIRIQSSTPENE